MKTFKKCKVVMLPTGDGVRIQDGKTPMLVLLGEMWGRTNLLGFADTLEYQRKDIWWVRSGNLITDEYKNGNACNQYLYILSDDDIKEGDWVMNEKGGREIYKVSSFNAGIPVDEEGNGGLFVKKIIATTDGSLSGRVWVGMIEGEDVYDEVLFPNPSDSFINEFIFDYNNGNKITDVFVEYNSWFKNGYDGTIEPMTLKIDSGDNSIIIKKIKDSWSRDEVLGLLGGINDGMPDLYSRFNPEVEMDKWEGQND